MTAFSAGPRFKTVTAYPISHSKLKLEKKNDFRNLRLPTVPDMYGGDRELSGQSQSWKEKGSYDNDCAEGQYSNLYIGRSQSDSQVEHRARGPSFTGSHAVTPFVHSTSSESDHTNMEVFEVDCGSQGGCRTYPQDDCLNVGESNATSAFDGGVLSSRARYNFQAGLLLTAEVITESKARSSPSDTEQQQAPETKGI